MWVDLSATSALLAHGPFGEPFAWVCRKMGTDPLLFASDYPLDEPRTALAAVHSLGFSAPELRAILYDHAANLFGPPAFAPTRARPARR